jgi:hypothetical protein
LKPFEKPKSIATTTSNHSEFVKAHITIETPKITEEIIKTGILPYLSEDFEKNIRITNDDMV